MPENETEALRDDGFLRRRRPTLRGDGCRVAATLHLWKGLEGPFACPAVCAAARRARFRPAASRKCRRAVTRDVLDAASFYDDAERSRGKAMSLEV